MASTTFTDYQTPVVSAWLNDANAASYLALNYATTGGTSDAITATFNPVVTQVAVLPTLEVRATAANATTTPTFTPNAGVIAPHTITKYNGQALLPGDISGAGHWMQLLWDATSSTWELLNPASAPYVTAYVTAAVAANVIGHNFIDNPEARIAQRATSGALTTSYTYVSADRWCVSQATTAQGHFNVVATALPQFKNVFQLGRTSGATSTGLISMRQALESNNSISLSGLQVVFSFYAYAGANFSAAGNQLQVELYSGTGTDQSAATMTSWSGTATLISATPSLTTGVVRYQYSVSVPSTVNQLGVQIGYTPTGTAGADDNLYITGIKLEDVPVTNPVATQYVSEDYSVELNRCLRYYWQQSGSNALGSGVATGTTSGYAYGRFPIPMRAAPTITVTTPSGGLVTTGSGNTALTALTGTASGAQSYELNFTVASGLTTGSGAVVVGGGSMVTSATADL